MHPERPSPPWRRRAVALLAACHPEPALAVTALSTLLAARSGRSAAGVVLVALAVGTGQLSVGWSNDWLDAGRDAAARRPDKPVAAGAVPVAVVRAGALTALAAAVALSFGSGWRAGAVDTVAIAAAWSYNLGLKATVASPAPYLVAFGLLPAFLTLGLAGHPPPHPWAVAAGMLLGAGAHFANVLPDIGDDLAAGVRGLPQRAGPVLSRLLSLLALLAASGCIALGARPRDLLSALVLTLAAAVAAGGILALRRPAGSRLAFRSVLVMAALDVALLALRGSTLG